MAARKLTVALDWTPNINHVGFYAAKASGWYAEAGLDVTLLSTHHDAYKRTPASRVADGTADFAVTPTETVVSSHTPPAGAPPRPKLVAVAALQAKTPSAVVTLKASGRDRPAKLDGADYASYGARYEGRIVQELIKAAGGTGTYNESVPPMLGIWNTLLAGKADATWVFMGCASRACVWLRVGAACGALLASQPPVVRAAVLARVPRAPRRQLPQKRTRMTVPARGCRGSAPVSATRAPRVDKKHTATATRR